MYTLLWILSLSSRRILSFKKILDSRLAVMKCTDQWFSTTPSASWSQPYLPRLPIDRGLHCSHVDCHSWSPISSFALLCGKAELLIKVLSSFIEIKLNFTKFQGYDSCASRCGYFQDWSSTLQSYARWISQCFRSDCQHRIFTAAE